MFTWRYFAFLCAVVAWSLANYLLFLLRWTGDGASELSLNRTLDASSSGVTATIIGRSAMRRLRAPQV